MMGVALELSGGMDAAVVAASTGGTVVGAFESAAGIASFVALLVDVPEAAFLESVVTVSTLMLTYFGWPEEPVSTFKSLGFWSLDGTVAESDCVVVLAGAAAFAAEVSSAGCDLSAA